MSRNSHISAAFLILYLAFFAHAAVPHDHVRHNSFDPVCCELLSHDEDDAEHHHLPQHGADQISDIFTFQEVQDNVPCFMQLVAILEPDRPCSAPSEQEAYNQRIADDPPLESDPHPSLNGFRAPPVA